MKKEKLDVNISQITKENETGLYATNLDTTICIRFF